MVDFESFELLVSLNIYCQLARYTFEPMSYAIRSNATCVLLLSLIIEENKRWKDGLFAIFF